MGNSFKRNRSLFSDNDFGQSYWLGASAISSRLPSCWDELIDWTEDASHIFQIFLKLQKSTTVDANAETSNDLPSAEAAPMHFQPLVLKQEENQLSEFSSLNLIDQAAFLAENVIVVVKREGHAPGILTVVKFITLHRLLLAYLELLVLAQTESPTPTQRVECAICLEDNLNAVVLSCSHRMCSTCYERWVQRKLSCPFCRYEFQRRSVRQSQWEMLDWQTQDVGKDIRRFELRLEKFVAVLDKATIAPEILSSFEAKDRAMQTRDDQEIVIVN